MPCDMLKLQQNDCNAVWKVYRHLSFWLFFIPRSCLPHTQARKLKAAYRCPTIYFSWNSLQNPWKNLKEMLRKISEVSDGIDTSFNLWEYILTILGENSEKWHKKHLADFELSSRKSIFLTQADISCRKRVFTLKIVRYWALERGSADQFEICLALLPLDRPRSEKFMLQLWGPAIKPLRSYRRNTEHVRKSSHDVDRNQSTFLFFTFLSEGTSVWADLSRVR